MFCNLFMKRSSNLQQYMCTYFCPPQSCSRKTIVFVRFKKMTFEVLLASLLIVTIRRVI